MDKIYMTDGTQWSVREVEDIDQVYDILAIMQEMGHLKENAEYYYISEENLIEWEENFPSVYREIKEEVQTCLMD